MKSIRAFHWVDLPPFLPKPPKKRDEEGERLEAAQFMRIVHGHESVRGQEPLALSTTLDDSGIRHAIKVRLGVLNGSTYCGLLLYVRAGPDEQSYAVTCLECLERMGEPSPYEVNALFCKTIAGLQTQLETKIDKEWKRFARRCGANIFRK